VSVIALDQFVLWDNAAGPKSVKEFIEAAKAASSPFQMGGTGSKREDHVLTVFMEKRTGAKFSHLPYKSGGEAATQLVGNHTESNVNNPSENLEIWRAGQVRALCVFDKERVAYKTKVTETQSWNDIPTCKEEGLDVQYLMLRAMFLPGKVTPEQKDSLFRAYRKETGRQTLLLKKWGLAQRRLVFVVDTLRSLLSEPAFVSILRAEAMHTLPQPLAELIESASNFSSSYANTLLAAIKQADLALPDKPKQIAGVLPERMARMERETASLHRDYKAVETSYGKDILNLVITTGSS
jgi:hypothetical protein